jgi:hypothetical protein
MAARSRRRHAAAPRYITYVDRADRDEILMLGGEIVMPP